MFKNTCSELGKSIERASQNIHKTAEEIGNIEKASENIKTGLIYSSLIIMGGLILNTILSGQRK